MLDLQKRGRIGSLSGGANRVFCPTCVQESGQIVEEEKCRRSEN